MNCPRCETGSLTERDRDGVTLDVCPRCRGVWLDRGELEKLIARNNRDFEALEAHLPERGASRPYRDDDDDKYGDDRRPPRKRRWLDSVGDLFD